MAVRQTDWQLIRSDENDAKLAAELESVDIIAEEPQVILWAVTRERVAEYCKGTNEEPLTDEHIARLKIILLEDFDTFSIIVDAINTLRGVPTLTAAGFELFDDAYAGEEILLAVTVEDVNDFCADYDGASLSDEELGCLQSIIWESIAEDEIIAEALHFLRTNTRRRVGPAIV